MKKSHCVVALLALTCVASAVFYAWNDPQGLSIATIFAGKPGVQGGAAATAGTPAGSAQAGPGRVPAAAGADLLSPFASGAGKGGDITAAENGEQLAGGGPDKEVISPEEAARRKKMEALGYMVPTDYYSKDVKTLRVMAQGGDAFAMVHLGEKYYFELNGNKSNPDFDSNTDYPSAAKQSFKDALAAGNIRSAGIISELYLQENNSVEAYAWHIVSEQMGDSISADWFRGTKLAQQANGTLKQEAAARAAQITAELNALKKKSA